MDKITDLEAKYQKLAAEYSKVRSQATVLKKAVIDEQAKNNTLKDMIKLHEQKIRKHDQEMESLNFRNEQLTKRISVLQQDLQVNGQTPKKGKRGENALQDTSVVDEELQKKILENAQLASSMVDKDFELSDCKERINWLEDKLDNLQKDYETVEQKYQEQMKKSKNIDRKNVKKEENDMISSMDHVTINRTNQHQEEISRLREEVDRWRTECQLLRSKPEANGQLNEYYESQLRELLEGKQMAQSEANAVWGENNALYKRLEDLVVVNKDLDGALEKSNEELLITTENYKGQLDAMTEHLAAQNDKITKQCDEIQALKHKLSAKK